MMYVNLGSSLLASIHQFFSKAFPASMTSAASMTPAEASRSVFVFPNGTRVMASDTKKEWANDPFYEPRVHEATKSANGFRTNGFETEMETCTDVLI